MHMDDAWHTFGRGVGGGAGRGWGWQNRMVHPMSANL